MASPRLSFSGDLASDGRLPSVDPDSASVDFDFGVSADASSDFSHADDLFLNGVIRPSLHVEASVQSPKKPCDVPHVMSDKYCADHAHARKRSPSRKSLWPFRRSSSLDVDGGRSAGLCSSKLLRSKSAEAHYKQIHPMESSSRGDAKRFGLKRKNGASPEKMISSDSKARRYYYSGGSRRSYDDGVRIGLVLNVSLPSASAIMKAFSSLLMCGCGGKRTRKETTATS